jgi:hypothetical protein
LGIPQPDSEKLIHSYQIPTWCSDLRILYIPWEEEECCRVKEGEGDGKDEGGWGEGGVVRTRHQRQLSEEDGNQEEGEV